MKIKPNDTIEIFAKRLAENVNRVNCKPVSYSVDENLRHSILNIADETGELIGVLKDKMYYNKHIDPLNLIEELGDLQWAYILAIQTLAELLKIPFVDLYILVFEVNNAKLKSRYQDNFTTDEANKRDLGKEYYHMYEAMGKYQKNLRSVNL